MTSNEPVTMKQLTDAKKNRKQVNLMQRKITQLIMHDCSRAYEFVYRGITSPLQLGHILLRFIYNLFHPSSDTLTHISYRLETRHFIPNGRLARKQVCLVGAQSLSIERHSLSERGKLRGKLGMN